MRTGGLFQRVAVFAFAALFAANAARAGIAYIESDGVDDWVDTECRATPQTKLVVEMAWLGNVNGCYPFGSSKDGVNMCIGLTSEDNTYTGKIYWRVKDGNDPNNTRTPILAQSVSGKPLRVTFDLPGDIIDISTLDGKSETSYRVQLSSVVPAADRTHDSAFPMAIFSQRKESVTGGFAQMKLYSFRWYEGEELVHHYLPYCSADGNTVGLVDIVSGEVLENKGTGRLVYGEDPVEGPTLTSSGTQFVNTGYIVKPNSRVEFDLAYQDLTVSKYAAGVRKLDNSGNDVGYRLATYITAGGYWGCIAFDHGWPKSGSNKSFSPKVAQVRSQIAIDRHTLKAELTTGGQFYAIDLEPSSNSETAPCGLGLFGRATSDTTAADLSGIRLYSCRVYEYEGDDPVLLHEYLPCLKDGTVACLRDSKTGDCFLNLGEGDFAYGPAALRADSLTVIGFEGESGADDPRPLAGTTVGYAEGETVDAHVACDTFTDAGGKIVSLTGWELSTNTAYYAWAVWRTGSTTNCTFVHPGRAVQLKWLWSVSEVSADIRELAANGDGGDTLVLTGRLEDFEGENCTFRILTGATAEELTNEWPGLEGLVRTERGAFSFTLHEPNTASARYLKPSTTVYVAVEATANGSTLRTAPIPVALKSAVELRDIAAKGVQRKLTVSGKVVDAGMRGESPPVVSLWGGTTDDVSTFTRIDEADLVGGAFSLVWNVQDFDTPCYWQVRVENESAGGTANVVTSNAVVTSVCVDGASYAWKPSVAAGAWEEPGNWTSDKDDCIGYPRSSGALAKFAAATTASVEIAQSVSIGSLDISKKNLNLRFVAKSGGVTLSTTTFPAIGVQTSDVRYDSSFVFDGVSLALPSGLAGIAVGSGSSLVLTNGAEFVRSSGALDFILGYESAETGGPVGVPTYMRGQVDFGASMMPHSVPLDFWLGGEALVRTGRPLAVSGDVLVGMYSGGGGGTVEFYGLGTMTVAGMFRCRNSRTDYNIPSYVNFIVPKDGYVCAPLVGTSATEKFGGELVKLPLLHIAVPATAPIFRTSAKREVPLISWPAGIVTNNVVLDACPKKRGRSYLYYTYDDNGNATGVSLHYAGAPGFMIVIGGNLSSGFRRFTVGCVNCGEYDYGDGKTSAETYQANWNRLFAENPADVWFKEDTVASSDPNLCLEAVTASQPISNSIVDLVGECQEGSTERHFARRLVYRFGARTVAFYELHLVAEGHISKVKGEDGRTPSQRLRQRQFAGLIEDARQFDGAVFSGDFNAQQPWEYDIFKLSGYTCANCSERFGVTATLRDIPADNIIVSSWIEIETFRVVKDIKLNTDHFPLVARLRFKGEY